VIPSLSGGSDRRPLTLHWYLSLNIAFVSEVLSALLTQNADDVLPEVFVGDDLDVVLHDDVGATFTVAGE